MRPTTDGSDTRNARGRATVRSTEREAVRLALEHGAAALTVDQICEAVGISQRAFFNHFDTKDDALLGWELPRLNEQRVRKYLAEPAVGVLSGAVTLVDQMAASPTLRPPIDPASSNPVPGPGSGLEDLRWAWDRLL